MAAQQASGLCRSLQHLKQPAGQAGGPVDLLELLGGQGVSSAGLKIIAFPHASAGADFQHAICSG